jgi:hypothetical protein
MSESTPVPPAPVQSSEPPTAPPPPPVDPAQAFHNRVAGLIQRGDNGAKWFYWVAGLSLVNSAIQMGGGGIYFVVGLGATLVADSMAVQIAHENPDIAMGAKVLTIGFDVIVALILCIFGWLSTKRYLIFFAIGMVLYVLDGMLFILFQDWMSVAFHAFALYSMIGGFLAYREVNALQRQLTKQAG